MIILDTIIELLPYGESKQVDQAVSSAIDYEFTDTRDAISDLDSADELSEHIDFLYSLAKITGNDPDHTKAVVQERLNELEDDYPAEEKSFFFPRKKLRK